VISGFCRAVDEKFPLVGYEAAISRSSLPAFRYNL